MRVRAAAPAGMEHVNGGGAATPRYLLNGGGVPGASAAHRLEAALAACSTAGIPVSAAALAGGVTSAGLPVTPAGLSVTPAGLSVTPSGAPAGQPVGLVSAGPPTSGRQSVPALSRSPLLAGPPLPTAGVVFSRNRYGQGK